MSTYLHEHSLCLFFFQTQQFSKCRTEFFKGQSLLAFLKYYVV